MAPTATKDFTEYVDKRVVVTRNIEEDGELKAVEIEGTIQAVNTEAVLLKPKGKTNFDLINVSEIEDITLADTGERKIKAAVLKPVVIGQAKRHLLERHGATLAEVNGLSEEQAYEAHGAIDHVAEDLGHVHGEKKAKAASEEEAA